MFFDNQSVTGSLKFILQKNLYSCVWYMEVFVWFESDKVARIDRQTTTTTPVEVMVWFRKLSTASTAKFELTWRQCCRTCKVSATKLCQRTSFSVETALHWIWNHWNVMNKARTKSLSSCPITRGCLTLSCDDAWSSAVETLLILPCMITNRMNVRRA